MPAFSATVQGRPAQAHTFPASHSKLPADIRANFTDKSHWAYISDASHHETPQQRLESRIMTAALKKILEELRDKKTRVHLLQARLSELQEQKNALLDAPVSLADYREVLRGVVTGCGARVERGAAFPSLVNGVFGTNPQNRVAWRELAGVVPNVALTALLNRSEPFDLLCWMEPEKVEAALYESTVRRIGDVWGNEEVLPIAEREKLVAALEAQAEPLRAEAERLLAEVADITSAVGDAGA